MARKPEFDLDKAFEAVAVAVDDAPTEGDEATLTLDDISSFLIGRNYAPTSR